MSRIIVGVDVGGTSTRAAVIDGTETVARAGGTGAVMRTGKGLAAATTIAETVRRALAAAGHLRAGLLVAGVAGAGRESEREELRQALRGEGIAERVIVTGDTELALAAAFGRSPGILLTAGTGSMAVARDPAGALHRAGGLGWQMGDEGSGYAIGQAALKAAGRAADGGGPATALTPRLLAAARTDSLEGLVRWAATAGVPEVAGLAPEVLAAAEAQDPIAAEIVSQAARDLTELVVRLIPHFGAAPAGTVAVATNGGLLKPGISLYHAVMELLRQHPRLAPRDTLLEPALGAVHFASD
jgi:N-acetylglucosamine kinase-like BadF-type ATPase